MTLDQLYYIMAKTTHTQWQYSSVIHRNSQIHRVQKISRFQTAANNHFKNSASFIGTE